MIAFRRNGSRRARRAVFALGPSVALALLVAAGCQPSANSNPGPNGGGASSSQRRSDENPDDERFAASMPESLPEERPTRDPDAPHRASPGDVASGSGERVRPAPASPGDATDATNPAAHSTTAGGSSQAGSSSANDPGATSSTPPRSRPEPAVGDVIENSVGMKLVYLPPGEFQMGSPPNEPDRTNEELQHPVKLTKGFYIGVHEVTQAQYRAVMKETHFFFSREGEMKKLVADQDTDAFPAEGVSWEDAVEFCRTLNHLPEEQQAGRKYRLPTEAEWEYACRAGTTTATAFGDSLDSNQANFAGTHPYNEAEHGPSLGRPTTVGSYEPNAWGLYDTHGNVWEWCYDIYDGLYFEDSPLADPTGPKRGDGLVAFRSIRGGGWDEAGLACRSATRSGVSPSHRGKHFGFRVLCTVQ